MSIWEGRRGEGEGDGEGVKSEGEDVKSVKGKDVVTFGP